MKKGAKGVVTLHRSVSLLIGLLALHVAGLPSPAPAVSPETIRPYGIVVIGDPHLPGKHLPAKEALIRTIDGWDGIDRVVVLGDICNETGTDAEYAFAKAFFARLHKPLRFVTGKLSTSASGSPLIARPDAVVGNSTQISIGHSQKHLNVLDTQTSCPYTLPERRYLEKSTM